MIMWVFRVELSTLSFRSRSSIETRRPPLEELFDADYFLESSPHD